MKRLKLTLAVCAIGLLLLPGAGQAMSPVLREMEDGFIRLNEEIRPCVVNIDTKGSAAGDMEAGSEDLHNLFRFFGMPGPDQSLPNMPNMPKMPRLQRMATGSGLIYDKQGHIVTNNHVVEDADSIMVKLSNGKEYAAKVIGRDPDTDLAVIKIEPDVDLPVAKLADSSLLKVGQFAVACGSPRGLEGSMSFGHVSALGRNVNLPGMRFRSFVQTDAAINLGNSGGPLCNIDGEVIGINVAIVYGANSLGFAIPVNTVKDIVPILIAKGKVTRGYLGVGIVDVKEYAESVGITDNKGAFVQKVEPDAPAARAGIKRYDVIRKVNGAEVESADDLVRKISALLPGADTKVEVWRDKQPVEVSVKLDEYQPKAGGEGPGQEQGKSVLGFQVQNLTPELAERMRLKAGVTGVVVVDVDPGSAAEDSDFGRGDIITEVAQRPVTNTDEFRKLLTENAVPGKTVLIGVLRGGEQDIVVLKVPKEEPK